MKHLKFLALALLALPLAGCVDRASADAKLAKGCEAGIMAFIDEGLTIKQIKKATYKKPRSFGSGYRQVSLDVVTSDGWYEPEVTYKCVFAEEFGMFNSSHRATIYQLNLGGRVIGQKDGNIMGSMEDQTKLTEAVENAMR